MTDRRRTGTAAEPDSQLARLGAYGSEVEFTAHGIDAVAAINGCPAAAS